MRNELVKNIFEKMKSKDFGESMSNETKLKVLKWVLKENQNNYNYSTCEHSWKFDMFDHFGLPASKYCEKCDTRENV